MKKKRWLIITVLLLLVSIGVNVYQYQTSQDEMTAAKTTDLTAMRGLLTELAVRIGDEDATDAEIKALAFSFNRTAVDLSDSKDLYPGGHAEFDFYQKTARTLLTYVNNQNITEMPIQQRDTVFQIIMSGLSSRDADFIEQQIAQLDP
ncbi:hypothetical protein LF817_12455 [Halobacillus sp. A1]|uniref:hypothetical protein n=1 Tax=Halobacillus sp. A1 TaxID=2880262 RepID=UPI0020A63FFA|nr:hypothetical protein [Halobacillus sp. A1]MCP3032155.1 hypothetical protein [Halobacillus sp. A1]